MEVQQCYSFRVDGFVTGKEDGHFRTSLIGNSQNGIVSLRFGQFDDKVHRDSGKRECVRLWKDRGERGFPFLGIDFIPLAVCATFYVLFHLTSHFGPPQMLLYELRCPRNSGVPHGRWVMVLADNLSPLSWVGSDYLMVVFPPFSLGFD